MYDMKKERYVTRAIVEGSNLDLQLSLWNIRDAIAVKSKDKLDYLQIFNITVNEKDINIINRQEYPCIVGEFVFVKNDIAIRDTTVWMIGEPEK
ncbi:DUF960 family protein [Bacillus thuringiensis]|uniref:DUF960 family protein n=1 Tax=Bacillus thuringiensis TaxID=1428 RepID=UPI001020EAE9|nr:DUF960 family protein [Bacillus thuringiensis]